MNSWRAPSQRAKRVNHYKQQIDWLPLFQQVQSGRTCAAVAAEHSDVTGRNLQKRYQGWCEAKEAGDAFAVAKWEGKVSGTRYNHSTFTAADEAEVTSRLRATKQAGPLGSMSAGRRWCRR